MNYIKKKEAEKMVEIQVNMLVIKQDDFYVAFCPSLNLSSYGDTVEDAKAGFDEVFENYISEMNNSGGLQKDLIENGWSIKQLDQKKKVEPPAMVELNIPSGLLRQQFSQHKNVLIN